MAVDLEGLSNEELVKAYQNGNKAAMDVIVEKNRGLVFTIIFRYDKNLENTYLEKDDLEQLGFIGLMEAVKGFDHSKGFKFTSYAGTAIMGYITRGLRVSTPWEKRSDTSSKICEMIGINEPLPGSENITYLDAIEDPNALAEFDDINDLLDRQILKKEVKATMDRVFSPDDRERQALIMRYGLNDYRDHTLDEIGVNLNVSRSMASGLVNKGLKRIKNSRAGQELKRKYLVEFGLEPQKKKAAALEYKDPSRYLVELELLRRRLRKSMK